jgi:tetratricopeptide (TPR) repeat protein
MSSRCRYSGLQPFQSDDVEIFFGRDPEISTFLSMILQDKLAILYGKPGVGKLSFLKAGVLPALQKNFLRSSEKSKTNIYFIQPDQYNKEDFKNLSDQICKQICNVEKIDELKKVLYSLPENENILWNHLKQKELAAGDEKNNYVFVFERVEELFSYPEHQIHWFKSNLNDLLADYAPNAVRSFLENEELNSTDPTKKNDFRILQKELPVRIIFSISTDEFYLLNRFRNFLPNIFKNVYELRPIAVDQLVEVITKPAALPVELTLSNGEKVKFKTNPFDFAPSAVDTIKNFVCYHNSSDRGETIFPDMFSLQAICSYCEQELVEKKGRSTISLMDILSPITIIEEYYTNVIKELNLSSHQEQKVTALLEKEMIYGDDKWRLVLYEKMIIEKYGISKELLQKLLEIRLISKEMDDSGRSSYQVKSDIIAEAIINVAKRRADELVIEPVDDDLPQLKQLTTEIEKNPKDYSGYKKRGDHYYFAKKYEEALADYETALKLKPDDLEVYNYIGIIYLETNDYKRAIKYFLQASKKSETYYQPLYNLGITYSQIARQKESRKNNNTAIRYFKKALKKNPAYVDAYNQIGMIYESYEEYEKAKDYYQKALNINSDYIEVKLNLGNICYKQNDLEQAQNYYEEILSVNPNFAEAISNIGLVFWKKNDLKNAELQIKRACELDPYFEVAFVNLTNLYIEQEKYDEAFAALNKGLSVSDEIIHQYFSIATHYKEKKDYDKAEECLNRILQISPRELDAASNLGILLYYRQKNTEALKVFEGIKKDHPDYYNAYINAGLVYERLDDINAAIDNFNQAYRIEEPNVLAPYNLGEIYRTTGNYKKALEMFEKVEEINKTIMNPQYDVRDRLGEMYNKLKQPDKAITVLQSFLKEVETDAPAFHHLAMAYEQKKDWKQAFNSFYGFLSNTDLAEIQLEDYKLYAKYYEKVEANDKQFTSELNSIQLNYLGLAYEYLEKPGKAFKMYYKAVEKDPSDYYPNFNLGYILESHEKYDKALEWYLKANKIDNKKIDAVFGIANSYYHLNLYDEAEHWYSEADEIEKDEPNVILSFGNIAYVKGDFTRAYDYYIKSLQLNKGDVIYNNLGMVAERLGYLEKAIEYNLEASKLNSSFSMPMYNLGLVYTIKREYGQAFEYLEKGLRKKPGSYGFSNLGLLYHKLGYKEEALIFLQKSITVEDAEDDSYFNFANIYYDNNEFDLAEIQLEHTFRTNKYHKPSQILKAKIQAQKGDLTGALQLFKAAELIDPADYFVKLELAVFSINTGKFNQAETILNELKGIKFENPNLLTSRITETYGKLYETEGKFSLAIEAYQNVISSEPKNEYILKKLIVLYENAGNKDLSKEATKQLHEVQNLIKKETYSWVHYSFFTDLLKEKSHVAYLP